MSTASIQGPRSIYQSSIAAQKSIADQGTSDLFSLKNFNEKFLFPFYDELLRMVKLHPFFQVILVIVFIDQIFVSMSFYVNDNIANFFANFNINSTYESISFPIIYLIANLAFFSYLFFNYRSKRLFNYWQLYLASVFLNFFNVIFFVPVCGACGYSVYQLDKVINTHHSDYFHVSNDYYDDLHNYTIYAKNIFNRRFILSEINRSSITIFTKYYPKFKSQIYLNNSLKSDIFDKDIKYTKNYNSTAKIKKLHHKIDINIFNNNNNIKNNISIYDEPDEPKPPDISNNPKPPDDPDGHRPPDDHNDTTDIDFDFDHDHIKLIFNSDFAKHSTIIIFFIIEAAILYFELRTNYHFMSESPYLNRTMFAMWDCQVFLSYLLLIGINQFFYYFLNILPNWCTSLYQIIILVAIIYIMYYTFFQPFIKVGTNTFFQSMLTSFFLTTFFSFILYLKFTIVIFFLITLSGFFFFIFLIVYYIINKKIIKNIHKKLSPPENRPDSTDESLESTDSQYSKRMNKMKDPIRSDPSSQYLKSDQVELSENEKREIFDTYVFQSIEHALLYFRVGVMKASPYFVDFSFMRYMKEFYGQKPIQLFILQLSSLFPFQHQFFNFCMTTYCKKVEFFNMYENFIMYQLHRINIIRQSSVSKEVQNELFRLEKMSDDSISAIRGFWTELLQAKTELNTASLGFIRRMTLNTKSNYIDAIEKFPNSQQILNSYCRFLCEACGDYIECARIGQKMRLIEQGKNSNADHCFHSFVNVFPHYLKKRILNVHGNFIMMNSGSFSASQSSTSLSSDRLSASFDNARGMPIDVKFNSNNHNYNSPLSLKKKYKDEFENLIDQEHFETLINNLFTNGKQRLSIQKIVDRSKNRALNFARLISFIQFIASLIITIATFSYVSSSSNTIELMKSSARISKISSSLYYCSLVAGIQYMSERYGKNVSKSMIENLHIRPENLPKFPCTFIFPVVSLNSMKQQIVELFDKELKFLMQNPDDHIEELDLYTRFSILDYDYGDEEDTETQTKKMKKINHIQKILKKSVKEDDYDYGGDGDYDYGGDDGDCGGDGDDENNNEDDYEEIIYDYGVILHQFVFGIPFPFETTLKNAIDFVQASVERLAYEKSIFIIQNRFPDFGGNEEEEPFRSIKSKINLSKYERMKKIKSKIKNTDYDYEYGDDDYNYWYYFDFFDSYYNLIACSISFATPFTELYTAISDNAIDVSTKYSLKIRIVAEALIIVLFIVFVIIRIYNHIIIKQISKVSSFVMQKVKGEEIAEAMKPIYLKSKKGIKIHSASSHSVFEYSPTLLFFTIVGFTSIIIFIVFYAIAILIFLRSFNFIEKTFHWAKEGATRFLSLANILSWIVTEKTQIFQSGFIITDQLMLYYDDLINTSRKLDLSIIGQDKNLDNFYFMINEDDSIQFFLNTTYNSTNKTTKKKYPFRLNNKKKTKSGDYDYNFDRFQREMFLSNTKCSEFDNSNESTKMNFATFLDCISIDNKVNLAIHYYFLLDRIIQDIPCKDLIDTPEFIGLLFILDKYLYQSMPLFQDKILEILETEVKSQKNLVYMIGTIGLILSIIFLLIELILIRNISFSYEAFKQLIMVLPPSAFANNQFLINFLINTCSGSKLFVKATNNSIISTLSKFGHHHDSVLSEEETLINSTEHSVINTCKNLIIQSVNPSVQKMTGFPSDQLLGQGLIYLIPLVSKNSKSRIHSIERSPFYQRLEEIRSNSGDRVAEVNTACLTDKGDELLVQATIIGIFDKKSNFYRKTRINNDKKILFSRLVHDKKEIDSDSESTESTSASTTASTTILPSLFNSLRNNNNNNNNNEDEDEEEFAGATIILRNISDELKQMKEVKEAKKKTEELINFMIPQPVLEQIRTSRKKQFYSVENATIVKIEFCGLDEYIGSIMPKQIMTCLQRFYSQICSIGNKDEKILFSGRKNNKSKSDSIFENINSFSTNDGNNFKFNFDLPFETEITPRKSSDNGEFKNRINFSQISKSKFEGNIDEDEINDDDEDCDFGCVYNIRNDVDNFLSVSGLFDTQNEPKKQAESCLRYALKIRQIMENLSLEEDQVNLFIHAKIVVCMGGPLNGIVDDPEIPSFEIFSDLLNKADVIKKNVEIDNVYIDENVYNNIIRDNYEIEEKWILDDIENNTAQLNNESMNQKIYMVDRCVIKKKNDNNAFVINRALRKSEMLLAKNKIYAQMKYLFEKDIFIIKNLILGKNSCFLNVIQFFE